ncbi:hypothetical protein PDQ36_30795 [Bacillus cereus]|uniref:Uncharacterized protein n=1 Tax=Bacillus thuringiensis TaxID=1428 RepID=A0A9X6WMC5_BACTU|nr:MULTISPECIES: hypothetical protein [Bacillus cereus group]ANV74361.1 hypothetical protein BCM43_28330 [Bacillus thuringiensis]MDA2627525.1 hypothetical protein [Bacillus cereus]MDZ4619097.1 hypothetical protein [Bacillus cereus]PFD02739.1 hypothetical protein CN295_31665 [Bacillus cereus]PFJ38575.1 hypothetical protein COJ15_18025 [Bacillus thuringiensis]
MKKHLKKILVGGFCLATAFSVVQSSASAATPNYRDDGYRFDFEWNKLYAMTEWRWKNDASSSYMKCDEIYAQGGSARFYNAWVTDIEGQNVSKYHTYKFYQGSVHKMANYAYENNVKKVKIKGERGIGVSSVSAYGVWSPDSI